LFIKLISFVFLSTYGFLGTGILSLVDYYNQPIAIVEQHMKVFGAPRFMVLTIFTIIGMVVNLGAATFITILGIYHMRLKNMGMTTYEHILAQREAK